MYIQDPVERMEAGIERQISLIDSDGKYPCCLCGEKTKLDCLVTISAAPDSPAMCYDCAEDYFGEMTTGSDTQRKE